MAIIEMPIISSQDVQAAQRIRHPSRQNSARGVADRAHDQSYGASASPGIFMLLANGTNWLITIKPAGSRARRRPT